MTRSIFQLSSLLFFAYVSAKGQNIEGYWLSGDLCRKYEIKKDGNSYYCVLESSTRKADTGKSGTVVLRDIIYHKRKNYYSGEIISLVDGSRAFTRIYINKENQRLEFIIYSFLRLFSVKIYWSACP